MSLFEKKKDVGIDFTKYISRADHEYSVKTIQKELDKKNQEIVDLEHKTQLEKETLEHEHKLALAQKEFDITHFKDEELKKAEQENFKLQQEIAVVKKENEMLIQITNLNKDVLDVKGLVNKLIEKLPEVKISSLALTSKSSDK